VIKLYQRIKQCHCHCQGGRRYMIATAGQPVIGLAFQRHPQMTTVNWRTRIDWGLIITGETGVIGGRARDKQCCKNGNTPDWFKKV
jgi:hypothetical protein